MELLEGKRQQKLSMQEVATPKISAMGLYIKRKQLYVEWCLLEPKDMKAVPFLLEIHCFCNSLNHSLEYQLLVHASTSP